MLNYETKCPKCGKPVCPYHRYYVTDKETLKLIEVCKACSNESLIRRRPRMKGETIVID